MELWIVKCGWNYNGYRKGTPVLRSTATRDTLSHEHLDISPDITRGYPATFKMQD